MDRDQRFVAFVQDLERISAQHGVVIQVVGNVNVQDAPLEAVTYSKDPSSGDIMPLSTKRFDLREPRRWPY